MINDWQTATLHTMLLYCISERVCVLVNSTMEKMVHGGGDVSFTNSQRAKMRS